MSSAHTSTQDLKQLLKDIQDSMKGDLGERIKLEFFYGEPKINEHYITCEGMQLTVDQEVVRRIPFNGQEIVVGVAEVGELIYLASTLYAIAYMRCVLLGEKP